MYYFSFFLSVLPYWGSLDHMKLEYIYIFDELRRREGWFESLFFGKSMRLLGLGMVDIAIENSFETSKHILFLAQTLPINYIYSL